MFDEPLSNLDARLRTQMRGELALMRQGLQKNIIYVTHDQIEAMTLGDRIVVMAEGRVRQCGTPADLYERPADLFVAGFIGSPPMNFMKAKLRRERDEWTAVGEDFFVPLLPDRVGPLQNAGRRDLIVGIRPMSFAPAAPDTPAGRFRMRVLLSEYIGATSVLTVQCGDAKMTVETDSADSPAPGDFRNFYVSPNKVHFFDSDSHAAVGTV